MTTTSLEAMDPIEMLGERIAETAAQIDSATHRFADIRAFDDAEGWHRQGALSCAHWLNWRCGIALGAAREKVRVAHALATLPEVDEALRRGEVSYSKARAITRVATARNETALLDFARSSTASQLERLCRSVRQTQPVGDDASADTRRFIRVRETDDGMVRLDLQLTPEEAAILLAACDVSAD